MRKTSLILLASVLLLLSQVTGQNTVVTKTHDIKDIQLTVPETSTEYSISSYKNVDFTKISPMHLEAAGIHTEIYISNTHRGLIIISSAVANKTLRDFSHTLDLNPNFYETTSRLDTTILLSGNHKNATFDFSKVSSINHDYKNAFNYSIDPRTGESWSKGNYDEINVKYTKGEQGYGQLLYDLIIWAPKVIK